MTPTGNLTYPWGLVYNGILLFVTVIMAVLAATVMLQRRQIKELLARRDRNKPAEQKNENICGRQCGYYCQLEDIVIPEMQQEITYWKIAHSEAMKQYTASEGRNVILQSTIAKLRMNNKVSEGENYGRTD